jgi:REP-associated tyrosine transposase
MPRRPRVFVEGLIYHVYNRAGRGEAPFKLEGEAQTFWSLLAEVAKRDGLTVYAWCIMPNHYHLAVRTATVPLWRSIRVLQHRYTQLFNRRARVFGPLWQSRYKARPVTGHISLLRLLAYIHLNPVAAMMVEDPARYRWSGHRELVRRVKEPLIAVDSVLTLFGGTRREALDAYLSLVRQERKTPWLGAEILALPWWRETPEVKPPTRGVDALGWSSGPTRRRLTAEELLAGIGPLAGVTIEELASPRRTAELVDARELIGGVAIERWGIQVKALAEALGKSREGVSKWVRRAAKRRSEDEAFFRRMEDLDRQLADELEATSS